MQMAVRGRGSGRLISGIVEIINKGEGRVKKGETGEWREGAESVTSGCRVWHTYFTKVPNRKHRRRHFVKFIAKWPPCECQLPTPRPPSFPSPALSATAGQAICAVLFLHSASDMLAVASRLKCPLKCRSQFRPRAALTFDTLIATARGRGGGKEESAQQASPLTTLTFRLLYLAARVLSLMKLLDYIPYKQSRIEDSQIAEPPHILTVAGLKIFNCHLIGSLAHI